jgi:phosphoribosylformylglycinamidine synthase I
MKAGIVVFPGSNCDTDTHHVLQDVMGLEVSYLWHKEADLKQSDLVVLPGGFAHGDYLRAGAIARFSPVMKEVIRFAGNGGQVLGICNGFQVLCEARLLPGALVKNQHQTFICKNLPVQCTNPDSTLTSGLEQDEILHLPVAHGEGRYVAHRQTLDQLWEKEQVLLQYAQPDDQYGNPNGSADAIAAISNEKGNVTGIMPHPERASEAIVGNTDGARLLEPYLQALLTLT